MEESAFWETLGLVEYSVHSSNDIKDLICNNTLPWMVPYIRAIPREKVEDFSNKLKAVGGEVNLFLPRSEAELENYLDVFSSQTELLKVLPE